MKKPEYFNIRNRRPDIKKLILTMKLSLILIFTGIMQVSATVYSQQTKMSFTLRDKTVKEVLNQIESCTDFRFFYNESFTDLNRKVTIEAQDNQVEEILDEILASSDVTYRVLDNNLIVITPKSLLQQLKVTGIVTDAATGEKLPGVNIVIKGTLKGVITGIEGNYEIAVENTDAVLVFSYVGYISEEIKTEGRTSIDMQLTPDITQLDEIVVVGYGTTKRSDLTGAVSTIKSQDVSLAASANVTQMMQGKAAGVQIIQQSAQPGGGLSIRIRGMATNSNSEPLYVIDGFPVYDDPNIEPGGTSDKVYSSGNRSTLNTINPNDIESIEVLKDASAAAIYGARAANGVILITTKRGKEGIHVSYNGRYSAQKIIQYMDVLNAEEFMDFYDMARKQYTLVSKKIEPYGTIPYDPLTSYKPVFTEEKRQKIYDDLAREGKGKEGTDWFSLVTRPGYINDQNLSISGGTDKTKYYSSFSYFDQKGVVINSALKRFTGRLNVDQEINDRIKTGINLTGSQINNQNAVLGSGVWENEPVIGSALGFPPIYPVYDTLGNYTSNALYDANPNPVSYKEIQDQTVENRWLGTTYVQIKILEGLTFRPSFGFDNYMSDRDQYLPKTFKYGAAKGGIATKGSNRSSTYLFDMVLNYNKAIGDAHNLSAVAGYSYQKYTKETLRTENTGFFTDIFATNRIQAGSDVPITESSKLSTVLASYFGRVNYSYKSKYLVTLTGRVDGSDRFGVNNKYAFFPSVALGWNLAKEQFMSSLNMINNLKIRFSAGQTGNSVISGNAFAFYEAPTGARYQFNDLIYPGMVKTQQENPNLKWETTTELNYGLDFGIFENRVSGSFEYFNKEISGLLTQQNLQIYNQVRSIFMNVGKTQTTGYEISLDANIFSGELKWRVNVNLSHYISKWKERSAEAIAGLSDYDPVNGYFSPIYEFVPDHIMQIGEAVPYPDDAVNAPNWLPGCLIVKDLDGWQMDQNGGYALDKNGKRIHTGVKDGKIDEADLVLRGTRDPKLIFGFGSILNYKGFELNFFFNGMLNYWIESDQFNFNVLRTEDVFGGFNRGKAALNTWLPDNPNGTIPSVIKNHGAIGGVAEEVQKISFLRLKSITLGYTIPKKIVGTTIRVYVDATNLLTFTNLKYDDPENVTFQGASQYGIGGRKGLYAYPNQKSYTLGLSVDF